MEQNKISVGNNLEREPAVRVGAPGVPWNVVGQIAPCLASTANFSGWKPHSGGWIEGLNQAVYPPTARDGVGDRACTCTAPN